MSAAPPQRARRLRAPAAAAALLAAVCIVFCQVRTFAFVDYDDREYVFANPHLTQGPPGERVRWAFTTFHAANWHPLTWISFIADAGLVGLEPGALHAENLVLHAANTVLAFGLFTRLGGSVGGSALAAALFALHPLRAESVAWVTERKGLLMALFSLAALHAHVSRVRRPSPWRSLAVAVWVAAALLAKPQAVVLPLLLLALDWWPLGRVGEGTPAPRAAPALRAAVEKLPLLALSAAAAALTLAAQRQGGAVAPLEAIGLLARAANAATAMLAYVAKTAWPAGLAPAYPLEPPAAHVAAAGALLLALTFAAALRLRLTRPWLLTGWAGFVAPLAPVSGILQVGGQAFADRYTYLPHLALFGTLVWSARALVAGRARSGRLFAGLAAAALVALAGAAHRQTSFWRDDVRLFSHAVEAVPGSWKMHYNLANVLDRRGDAAAAERHHRLALAARPDYPEALSNLGTLLGRRGEQEAAMEAFLRAVEIAPGYGPGWFNVGRQREIGGDLVGALEAYGRSAALQPGRAEPLVRVGELLLRLGRSEQGRAACAEALRVDPSSVGAAACLADAGP